MPTTLVRTITPAVQNSPVTTPKAARRKLRQFCRSNDFSDAAIDRALNLFEKVDKADEAVPIWRYTQRGVAQEAHEVFEAIVRDPVAHDLAVIAVDAEPHTKFRTFPMADACGAMATTN